MSTATAGPCDRGVAHAVAARPASAKPATHPTGTLAATILGSSLAFIDGSVVNVALPAIGATSASPAATCPAELINAYLLRIGGFGEGGEAAQVENTTVISGRWFLADRRRRRRR